MARRRKNGCRNQLIGIVLIFSFALVCVTAGVVIALQNVEVFNKCIEGEIDFCGQVQIVRSWQ